MKPLPILTHLFNVRSSRVGLILIVAGTVDRRDAVALIVKHSVARTVASFYAILRLHAGHGEVATSLTAGRPTLLVDLTTITLDTWVENYRKHME